MQHIRKHAGTLAIVLVCAAVCANIWAQSGIVSTRAGGDSPFLLIRIQQLATNLADGAFPARWMPDGAFGLGYPFFNFYASLPYYLAAFVTMAGIGLITALKLTQTAAIIMAAFAMRSLAQRVLPEAPGAVTLSAIAYTVAPFHLANIYTRGDSLSELWAFVWFPLILAALCDVTTRTSGRPLVAITRLTLALAALVTTHNVSALLFAPFIVLWTLALLWRNRSDLRALRANFLYVLCSAVLAVALSAWFWLPALSEVAQAQLGEQTTGFFYYANHFRQLGLCPLALSVDPCATRAPDQLNLIRSTLFGGPDAPAVFSMSLIQTVLALLGALLWATARTRRRMLALIGALALLATLLITPLSASIWALIKPLQLAQFPWRMLSVQAVFVSLLIGALPLRGTAQGVRAAAAGLLLLLSALPQTAASDLVLRSDDVNPRTIRLFEWYSGIVGTTIRAEYLPSSALPVPATGPDLLGQPRQALIAETGTDASALSSQLRTLETDEQRWQIEIKKDTLRMTLPLIYTAAWTAAHAETGEAVPLSAYAGSGWAALTLPKGVHNIVLRHTGTATQRWGERISTLASLAVAVLGVLALRRVSTAARRQYAMLGALTVLVAFGLVISDRLLNRKAYGAVNAEWVNFAETPFVNRAEKLVFDPTVSVAPNAREPKGSITGARIEPRQLRAGDVFTLSLSWRGQAGPLRMIIETPNGSERFSYFRTGRFESVISGDVSTHTVPTSALPGPLLLAIAPKPPYTALENGAVYGGAAQPGFTLVGPTVIETPPNAPDKYLAQFENGIRVHALDWLRYDGDGACFRAHWSRAGAINRADALQVSFKLYGEDDALVLQGDGQPLAGIAPTWSWPDNVLVQDSNCVPRSAAKRALRQDERYRLEVTWYRLANGEVTGQAAFRGVADMREGALNEPR